LAQDGVAEISLANKKLKLIREGDECKTVRKQTRERHDALHCD
jgi:hypothetical protein